MGFKFGHETLWEGKENHVYPAHPEDILDSKEGSSTGSDSLAFLLSGFTLNTLFTLAFTLYWF